MAQELYYVNIGDGSTTEYTSPNFDEKFSQIKVTLDNVETSDWSFNFDKTLVILDTAPAVDVKIKIFRLTDIDRIIDFQAGSITPDALDIDSNQLFALIQESVNGYNPDTFQGNGSFDEIITDLLKTNYIQGTKPADFVIEATDTFGFILKTGNTTVATLNKDGLLTVNQISTTRIDTTELYIDGVQIINEQGTVQIKGDTGLSPDYEINPLNQYEIRWTQSDGNWGPWYSYRGPEGPVGPKGNDADAIPDHEVNGNQIRFRLPSGSWGSYVVAPQGQQGIQGKTGPQGIQGSKGNKGEQGNQGIQGEIGPQGNNGAPGPIGPQGIPGTNGADGADGADGVDGVDGTDGLGVPVGGATNQALVKNSATNNDTRWDTVPLINDNNNFNKAVSVTPVVTGGLIDLTLSNNFITTASSITFNNIFDGQSGDIEITNGTLASVTNGTLVGSPPVTPNNSKQILSYSVLNGTLYYGILTEAV